MESRYDGPVAAGARLAVVADEQMLQERINFAVLIAAYFGILMEGKIVAPANSLRLENRRHGLVSQPFMLLAHDFQPHGAQFYSCSESTQRYFRTTGRSPRRSSTLSFFFCSLSG
ncbi:MAG: hypothetical protein WAK78_06280 [Candidatus Acidiferrales bacterium]